MKVKSLSRVWLFATPWTSVYQAPPSMGFSRQEYWSGVPLPSLPIQHRFSLIQNRLGWEQPLAQMFPLFSLRFSRFYCASKFTVVFNSYPSFITVFLGRELLDSLYSHCASPTSNPMMFWQQQLNTSCLRNHQIHGNLGWGINHQSSREDSQVSSFWLYSLVRHTVPFTEVDGFGQTPWVPYWSFALWLQVFGRVD